MDRRLEEAAVPTGDRADYRKWMRFYLDFCRKYGHPPREEASVEPFLAKLASKRQTEAQRDQASRAVRLLIGISGEPRRKTGPASRPAS